MGHIELAAPVSHIWYLKNVPSRMGLVLGMKPKQLEQVLYFADNIVLNPGKTTGAKKGTVITEKELADYRKYEDPDFRVGMGAEAIKELLRDVGLERVCIW